MEDKDILLRLIDELGLKSVNSFSKEVGYSSPSALYLVLSGKRGITEHLIKKIKQRYPNVDEIFLRGKTDNVFEEQISIGEVENYSLNDLSKIILQVLDEQKKTNELLAEFMRKQFNN